ncbi:MAG: hypothetical protein WC589_24970, partial [Sphingobacterium sp.]
HSEQSSQARQSRWYCRNRWESRSVPFFTRKPLLETVKGFFRLSTSVFPCTGYCPSSAYRLSQHMAVDEPDPSVAVPQLSLCSVVWSILVAEGNCNPVDSTHTAFTDRVKPYCFSPVSYSRISVSTARTTRNYWGNILSCYYPCQAILFFICIVLLYINGLAVATCNKQLYMLSDCWEVYR